MTRLSPEASDCKDYVQQNSIGVSWAVAIICRQIGVQIPRSAHGDLLLDPNIAKKVAFQRVLRRGAGP